MDSCGRGLRIRTVYDVGAGSMAGMRFTTDLDEKKLHRVALESAEDMGFEIREIDRAAFVAESGNLALSIFLGAFIAYCEFRITIDEYRGDSELTLERNNPWWTGLIGIARVKTRASELMTRIKDDVDDRGGRIFTEDTF